MADVKDLEERLAEHRRFITEDGAGAMPIRMYDGIADLLTDVVFELRRLNDNLERKPGG